MEASQFLGGKEGCSSSESGWTSYIGSPTHDDDDHSDDEEEDDGDDDDNNSHGDDDDDDDDDDNDDGDGDDDMTSDASSGPCHGEGGHGMALFKHNEKEEDNKSSSYEKAYKQVEKKKDERKMDEQKKESVLTANSSTSHVQGGAKVRKSTWMGKRK